MLPFDAQITFCSTTDLERTARFYEDVLGLSLSLDQGGCRIYRVAEQAFLGFCDRPDTATPRGIVLTLVTDDVDGWYAQLQKRQVEFEGPPVHNADYRIYHCFFKDPNGYRIEIQRFDNADWRG